MRTIDRSRAGSAGFSLVELIVALGVMTIVIVGILLLFDLNTKVARAQTNLAEMQQSLRVAQQSVAQDIRMAGRGGLIVGTLPAGQAVAVRNDVGAGGGNRDIAIGFAGSPQVVAGSDVLTLRGVFTAPIYQVNNANPASFTLTTTAGVITGGTVLISDLSPTGVSQSTQVLVDAVTNSVPEALILVSPLDDSIFSIVEVDPVNSNVTNPANVTLAFFFTGGTYTDAYRGLTGQAVFPAGLNSVAFVAVLEEYRYYVREEWAVPGDNTSDPRPRLSRARMFPGTEIPYGGSLANASIDIADNVFDLQLALGVDRDNDGTVVDLGDETDEWLYNDPDDDDTAVGGWNQPNRKLFYVRLNTLVRTDRRDLNYRSPPIAAIEDRAYGEPAVPADEGQRRDRMFRRRQLQTVIDMRNLA